MATIDIRSKQQLDHQFERVGWALFLIMIGGLMLVPGVPSGTWLVGAGLIMLGLNLARQLNGIRPSGFTTVVGIFALALGVSEILGIAFPVFPILLVVIGASILAGMLSEHQAAS